MRLPTRPAAALAALAASVTVPLSLAAPAAAATCPAPGGAAITEATAPAGAEVAFTGHGLGHSLGMSQYGAQGAARLGCTHAQILAAYYPGTQLAQKPMPAEIKLWMLQNGTRTDVLAENGPVAWQLSGQLSGCTDCPPVQPAGSTWRVVTDAARTRFQLEDVASGALVWAGGGLGTTLTAAHSGTVVKISSYQGATSYLTRRVRWDETRYTFDTNGLDAVQVLRGGPVPELGRTLSAMDKYLWGLGEVPISWTRDAHESLRAQVVAARTYAYRKITTGTTVLHPTPVHQYYTGYARESQDIAYKDQLGRNLRWAEAVTSTSDSVVLTATGSVVDTFFTSSHGGFGEDVRYVWGSSGTSYLRAIDDSAWDKASDNNTYRSWAKGMTRAEVAAKLGFDSISAITVAAPLTVERYAGVSVTGLRAGVLTTVKFTGWDVRTKLGLPSPGFIVTLAPLTGTTGSLGTKPGSSLVLGPETPGEFAPGDGRTPRLDNRSSWAKRR